MFSWHLTYQIFLFCMISEANPILSPGVKGDLSTSASWWNQNQDAAVPTDDFFSAAHGIVQSHPGSGLGVTTGIGSSGLGTTGLGGSGFGFAPSVSGLGGGTGHFGHDPLTGVGEEADELQKNPGLSSPEECARACRDGERPRTCYYKFVVENYMTLGA